MRELEEVFTLEDEVDILFEENILLLNKIIEIKNLAERDKESYKNMDIKEKVIFGASFNDEH